MDTIWKIINEQSITEDNELWDLDEVYFLNYEKDEVVLRDEKKGSILFIRNGLFRFYDRRDDKISIRA